MLSGFYSVGRFKAVKEMGPFRQDVGRSVRGGIIPYEPLDELCVLEAAIDELFCHAELPMENDFMRNRSTSVSGVDIDATIEEHIVEFEVLGAPPNLFGV